MAEQILDIKTSLVKNTVRTTTISAQPVPGKDPNEIGAFRHGHVTITTGESGLPKIQRKGKTI